VPAAVGALAVRRRPADDGHRQPGTGGAPSLSGGHALASPALSHRPTRSGGPSAPPSRLSPARLGRVLAAGAAGTPWAQRRQLRPRRPLARVVGAGSLYLGATPRRRGAARFRLGSRRRVGYAVWYAALQGFTAICVVFV
jgi:hypothetical protein